MVWAPMLTERVHVSGTCLALRYSVRITQVAADEIKNDPAVASSVDLAAIATGASAVAAAIQVINAFTANATWHVHVSRGLTGILPLFLIN